MLKTLQINNMYFLYWIIFIIIWLGTLYLSFGSYNLRIVSYFIYVVFFLFVWFLLLNFNKSILWYQIIFKFYYLISFQFAYIIGIDSISLLFVLLCSFLLMFCLLNYWFVRYKINLYIFTLFLSLWLLLNVFTSMDLFFFYVYFEGIVIPMFLLIVFEEVEIEKFMHLINFFYIPFLDLFLF